MARLSIANGLQAHFNQPEGPSRPGIDWIVVLHQGNVEKRLLIRTYCDNTPRKTTEQHAAAAIAYVSKLQNGNSALNEAGGASEIVVPDEFVAGTIPVSNTNPWWKFW